MNSTSKLFLDKKTNFCGTNSNGGSRIRNLMQALLEIGKINLKCSHKKGEEIHIQKFRTRDVPLTRLYGTCYGKVETVIVKFIEDKKVEHELMKLVLELTVVDVPRK